MAYVTYGGGDQTVYHLPLDRDGRVVAVAGATYRLVRIRLPQDHTDRVIVPDEAAVVDPVDTTTTSPAGPRAADPRVVEVVSTDDIVVGHTYLLRAGDRQEPVTVDGIDPSLGRVTATHELRGDYDTGAEFIGVELQGHFPGSVADDEAEVSSGGGPYAAIWQWEDAGHSEARDELVYLTRYSLAPIVSERDVLDLYPTLRSHIGDRVDFGTVIRAAMRRYVVEMKSAGKDPHLFRGEEGAKLAVCEMAIAEALRLGRQEHMLEEADRRERSFRRLVNNLTVGLADQGAQQINPKTDQAEDPEEGNGYWVRG